MMKKTTLALLTVLVFGIVISSEQEVNQKIESKGFKFIKYLCIAPDDGHKYTVISLASEEPPCALSFVEYQKRRKKNGIITMPNNNQYYVLPFKKQIEGKACDELMSLAYHQKIEELGKNIKKNF
jgi:hypothetical protein